MYQLTKDPNTIRRLADNASIPRDERNSDYQKFLVWEADGNTPWPEPAE